MALFVLSEAPFRRLVDFVLVWEEKPKVKKEGNISLLGSDSLAQQSYIESYLRNLVTRPTDRQG